MKTTERVKIMSPLLAAYEYGILAGGAYDSDERKRCEELMLSRLRHAVENAGYEMTPKINKAKAA